MKDLRRAVCAHGVYIREMSCKCLLPLAEQHFNALPQSTKDTLLTSQFKDSVFCLYSEMSFARLFHAETTSISMECTHTHTHTHTHRLPWRLFFSFSGSAPRGWNRGARLCLLNSRHSISYGRLTSPSALKTPAKPRRLSRDRLHWLSWRWGVSLPISLCPKKMDLRKWEMSRFRAYSHYYYYDSILSKGHWVYRVGEV